MKKIFVYGTLMKGEKASWMLSDAVFIGEYILDDYAIYNLGSFPGIKEKRGKRVFGELYEVSDLKIAQLDSYEGEDILYKRTVVSVKGPKKDTEKAYAYVYLGQAYNPIIQGKWK